MKKKLIKLANTVHWNPYEDDKVYIDNVSLVIPGLPFYSRQVVLRFANGPAMDLTFVDMDRIAVEYLKMRGIRLPAEARDLTKAKPPPRADFEVPARLMSGLHTEASEELPAALGQPNKNKRSRKTAGKGPSGETKKAISCGRSRKDKREKPD